MSSVLFPVKRRLLRAKLCDYVFHMNYQFWCDYGDRFGLKVGLMLLIICYLKVTLFFVIEKCKALRMNQLNISCNDSSL